MSTFINALVVVSLAVAIARADEDPVQVLQRAQKNYDDAQKTKAIQSRKFKYDSCRSSAGSVLKKDAANGTAAELVAKCTAGWEDARTEELTPEVAKMADDYPKVEAMYQTAQKSRKAKSKDMQRDVELAYRASHGIERIAEWVKQAPPLGAKPCGPMTCTEMATKIEAMQKWLRGNSETITNENRDAADKFQDSFIAKMKGGRKTAAKEQGGMPSACNGEAPSEDAAGIALCAKATTWTYSITSTNPNGGADIACEHTYTFAGAALKSRKKRCN